MRVQDSGQGELRPRSDVSLQEFFGRGEVFVRQLIAENDRLRSELHASFPDRQNLPEPHSTSVIEALIARVAELEAAAAQTPPATPATTQPSPATAAPATAAAPAGPAVEPGPSPQADDPPELQRRVDQLEHENYHLASMYVAGLQFHSARTLPEVLQTITEILLNFVGIGSFTLFVLDEERQVLFALAREGGDLEACSEIPVHDPGAASPAAAAPAPPTGAANGATTPTAGPVSGLGPIAAMIQRARPWTRGDPAYADENAIMYLPLVSNRRLVAVLRLESFLAQKPGFDDNDFSLLSMISEHAGIAIETAWIRAHAKAVALQRQAVEHLVVA